MRQHCRVERQLQKPIAGRREDALEAEGAGRERCAQGRRQGGGRGRKGFRDPRFTPGRRRCDGGRGRSARSLEVVARRHRRRLAEAGHELGPVRALEVDPRQRTQARHRAVQPQRPAVAILDREIEPGLARPHDRNRECRCHLSGVRRAPQHGLAEGCRLDAPAGETRLCDGGLPKQIARSHFEHQSFDRQITTGKSKVEAADARLARTALDGEPDSCRRRRLGAF